MDFAKLDPRQHQDRDQGHGQRAPLRGASGASNCHHADIGPERGHRQAGSLGCQLDDLRRKPVEALVQ
eukprot:335942-Alexandrium_andersonii.AAC.1